MAENSYGDPSLYMIFFSLPEFLDFVYEELLSKRG